jgi:hypothetical protein
MLSINIRERIQIGTQTNTLQKEPNTSFKKIKV